MMSTIAMLLWQDAFNPFGMFFVPLMMFGLVVAIIAIVGGWKVFEKAGQPGWAVVVPIYNAYILLKIAGRPGWWLLLCFIPVVNIIISLVVAIDVAKSFGQSAMFGFFLLFLFCGIGYLILGFGDYRYQGPAALTGV